MPVSYPGGTRLNSPARQCPSGRQHARREGQGETARHGPDDRLPRYDQGHGNAQGAAQTGPDAEQRRQRRAAPEQGSEGDDDGGLGGDRAEDLPRRGTGTPVRRASGHGALSVLGAGWIDLGVGGTVVDPEVVRQLLARRRDPLGRLTPREREVPALMAEGRSNAAVARALVGTEAAVATHMANILLKLDLPPAPDDHRRVRAVLAHLRG